ncbi:hypothetical protein [Pyrobaculum sp.]|uniref:hypothetical protein n=1 Tax=Pyrobaculum sp. TaxID=2004705 RepID=UPI003174DF8B
MMEDIVRKLEKGNVLFVAPMGWGKAAADTCQTTLGAKIAEELAKQGKRVGYIAPTLTLIDRKWDSLWSHLDVAVVASAGAGQLCARGHRYYPQRYCHKCTLKRSPPEGFTPPAKLHYSWLRENLQEDVCPYWVQESLLSRYPIILGHYGRLRRFRGINILIVDEIHEFVVPNIRQFDLLPLKERYSVIDASSLEALKESVDVLLLAHSDDEDLWVVYDILRSDVVWIEDGVVYGASLRNMPRDTRILGLTATPPPGWPPEGWELIEVKPEKKPIAFIFVDYEWRFDKLDELDAQYYINELIRFAGAGSGFHIAVFATTSRRSLLEDLKQRYDNIDIYDAWGRYRIGVDLPDYDVAIVLWPSLHISVRRYMRSRGADPDIAEIVNAIQLSGRIRPDGDKKVIFAGARFSRFWGYLSQFYELRELKL